MFKQCVGEAVTACIAAFVGAGVRAGLGTLCGGCHLSFGGDLGFLCELLRGVLHVAGCADCADEFVFLVVVGVKLFPCGPDRLTVDDSLVGDIGQREALDSGEAVAHDARVLASHLTSAVSDSISCAWS